jgi:hypothetical protein
MPVIINKVIPYKNLEKVRLSYHINDQNPYVRIWNVSERFIFGIPHNFANWLALLLQVDSLERPSFTWPIIQFSASHLAS